MLKVIVIEEDVAMRALVSEWIQGEGHEVLALPALPAAHILPGYDLVVLALANVRSQGALAVAQARACFPGAAVLGLSTQIGQSMGADSSAARALGLAGLVAKPCSREELLGALPHAGPACRAGR